MVFQIVTFVELHVERGGHMSNILYCYLAGPIAGCNRAEANDWRAFVSERLPPGIVGGSPLRCEPLIGRGYKLAHDDARFLTPQTISPNKII